MKFSVPHNQPDFVPTAEEPRAREQDEEKGGSVITRTDTDTDADTVSLDAQAGVQKIEATTKVWTKKQIIIAYIL